MPSKGPSGNTTTTTINPTQQAQLPFLQQGWGQAQSLYNEKGGPNYYPGNTLAPYTAPNNLLTQGNQYLADTAKWSDAVLRPTATGSWIQALNETRGSSSPAYNYMQQLAQGQNPDQVALRSQGDAAVAAGNQYARNLSGGNLGLSTLGNIAQGQGAGMQQLAQAASGQYLNSNPYLDKMAQAAMDPVARNYQTVTAPTLASEMAKSGRYGSGAFVGAQGQNEQNLGKSLADMSANIYGTNYANERARQDAAAQGYAGLQQTAGSNYGQLYNAGQTGAANAAMAGYGRGAANIGADLLAQGTGTTGLQGGYEAGNRDRLSALQQYPTILNAQSAGANQMIQAGQGLTGIADTLQQQAQAGINDQMNRFNFGENKQFKDVERFLSEIGQPTSGSSSTQTPYFQNQLASTLGGLAGVKSLLGGSGGGGGLGGLGGGLTGAGGILGSQGPLFGTAADAVLAAGGPPLALGTTAAEATGLGLGSMLPAAAAWIICTELTKQGKMDKRYWVAGTRRFAQYPEIGRRGYYVWAIPSVRHLRAKPDSLYSRFLGTVFRWRAEDIAARAGVKGARRLWRGRAVTAALVPVCLVLGAVTGPQDWQALYRERSA